MAFIKGMPVLFILMRTDLASMNPGKAIIQASHAANKAVWLAKGSSFLKEWEDQTGDGFGTGISLDGGSADNITGILDQIETARFLDDCKDDAFYGWLNDPTYPLRDGDFTHFIPLDTCAYVFCRIGGAAHKKLEGLELHP
jgi:peptidyl-tRNA hydrolase